jgi:hypothetical protein
MRFIEFKVDRKLDNNREPVNVILIKLSYVMGDKKIKRETVRYKSRSGYCLDAEKNSNDTIGIDEIGVLRKQHSANTNARNPRWVIYAYQHRESEALSKLNKDLEKKRQKLIEKANSIPTI